MRQSWQPDLKLLKKISYDNRLQKKKEKDQTKRKKNDNKTETKEQMLAH